MPKAISQTIPTGDRPFVSERTLALTRAAYVFLARVQQGMASTIQNVDVIGQAIGLPVSDIPAAGNGYGTGAKPAETTIPLLPAAFPPAPAPSGANAARLAAAERFTALIQPSRPAQPTAALPATPARPVDIVVLHSGARVMDGFGAPTGLVPGYVGDLYLQRDAASGSALWIKQSGASTADGWVVPSGGGDSAIGGVLPLVNGDTPGPAFLTDGTGQTIGVPV